MQEDFKTLFTTELSKEDIRYAKSIGLTIKELPFICTVPNEELDHNDILTKAQLSNTWIFTSKNALSIFRSLPNLRTVAKEKSIIVAGKSTSNVLLKTGFKSKMPLKSGAEGIISLIDSGEGAEPFLYFCGNRRLDVLPDYFRKMSFKHFEIETYKTIEQKYSVKQKDFSIIAFCSPSAVKSFFKNNSPMEEIQYLAIGKTTAKAIEQYSSNFIVSPEVTIRGMLQFIFKYKNIKSHQ